MATYTTYLNLEKPTTSETFNLLKMNQNWDKIDAGVSALNSNLENKAKYINLGLLSASGIKNILSAVYDALPGSDEPCLIKFNASGWWVGFAYKYSNSDYGVVSATRYNTQMYTLHVSQGVYTLVTYQTTSE